jgi:glucose/arabinose dehydrogenase
MNKTARGLLILTTVVSVNVLLFLWIMSQDKFSAPYQENCSSCHGNTLTGTPLGPALVGTDLQYGDSVTDISRIIRDGSLKNGMPAFAATLDDTVVQRLAIYVAEQRAGFRQFDLKIGQSLSIPVEAITTELHSFRLETVATDLDPLPFSIALLPDGRMLLTERGRGLSIVGINGQRSTLIPGAPTGYDDAIGSPFVGLRMGLGWMMDVALHPDYATNGWIYLQYGDRCSSCELKYKGFSMNKLVRGRIVEGHWVNEETIWQADRNAYTKSSDMGAGGRIAFDDNGHVFISVGIKGPTNYAGVQDLAMPWGKIHRMTDDGSMPPDNPFVDTPGALGSIWTYGHRSPQGLEFNYKTGQLWGTDMGPRGGDEVNLLLAGRNYGWPLISRGLNYDGTPVDYGKLLGLSSDTMDIEQPIVDLTPSPAVSSFIIYTGSAFPGWQQHMIVGSLKATSLYRIVVENGVLIHQETLIHGLARIRDVEADAKGLIYLLLEHADGSLIVRMVPE